MDHKPGKQRILFLFLLGVFCVFLTGCFKGESNVSIAEDGSVTVENTFTGVPLLKNEIDKAKKEMVDKDSNAKVKEINDGNMTGYEIDEQYQDIAGFAQNGGKMVSTVQGKCKGIQQHKGWFFDAYSFDFCLEGNGKPTGKNSKDDAMTDSMAKAMLAQIKFDFVLNLPYAAENTNADKLTNGNKTLSWNLASTFTDGNDKSMQATFKIWHKDRIAATVALAVIVFVLFMVLVWRVVNNKGDAEQKKTNSVLAVISACLLLILAVASAYFLYAPVNFIDGDIISATVEKSATAVGKNDTQPEKEKTVETKAPEKSVAGKDTLMQYAGRKDQFNQDIATLAGDINGYLASHADFRGTNNYNQRANSIYQQISSTRERLQNEVGVDAGLKGQLFDLLTAEMERVQGLRDGVIDSKSGHGYSAGFQRGTAASYRYDSLDAVFKQSMP